MGGEKDFMLPLEKKGFRRKISRDSARVNLMVGSVIIGADFLKSYLLDGLTAVGSQRSV